MRITITIDDPTPEVADWIRSLPAAVRSGPPPDPSPAPEPRASRRAADPDPDPDRPTDGRTLLGWADRHGKRSDVLRLGRSRKYPSKVVTWDQDQVDDVYQVLKSKPPKGSQTWGGAAESGHHGPRGRAK